MIRNKSVQPGGLGTVREQEEHVHSWVQARGAADRHVLRTLTTTSDKNAQQAWEAALGQTR